jgi:hypothetical protein
MVTTCLSGPFSRRAINAARLLCIWLKGVFHWPIFLPGRFSYTLGPSLEISKYFDSCIQDGGPRKSGQWKTPFYLYLVANPLIPGQARVGWLYTLPPHLSNLECSFLMFPAWYKSCSCFFDLHSNSFRLPLAPYGKSSIIVACDILCLLG